ncbi:MAG: NUDIX domain-containing protein [Nanoarchaeota archaeon]
MNKIRRRRRGVAIVEFKKGILVVSTNGKKFMLPGGGAKKFESRRKATIRELYEETGLKTKSIKYFFKYIGKKKHLHKIKLVKNDTKVFIVKSIGDPKPKNEIKFVKFWKPKRKISLTSGAKEAIERYLIKKKT